MAVEDREGFAGVHAHPSAIIGYEDPGQSIPEPSHGKEGIVVGIGSIIYKGTIIGKRCKIGHHVIIRPNVVLGDDSVVEDFSILGEPTGRPVKDRNLIIGERACIRAHSILYQGTTIGNDLQTGHGVVIREENIIGHHLNIWSGSTIDYGSRLGDDILIHNQVYIPQFTFIEDGVFLAPGVKIANDKYPLNKFDMKGPTIKRGSRVGMGSVLNPKITLGENSYIGAASMVTKDVPTGEIWMGNPAKRFGTLADLHAALKKRGFSLKDVIYKPDMDRMVMDVLATDAPKGD